MKNVLILSPHTDDAELGCGGTISRLIEEKANLLWVVFSTAEDSAPEGMQKDSIKNEFKNVIKKCGISIKKTIVKNFKVRYLHEKRQEVLELLIKIRTDFSPDLIIGPSLNDFHQDHQVVAKEMIRAFKTSSSIICYELPWNHITFNTQLFIKLSKENMNKKVNILKSYKSQVIKNRSYFTSEFVFGLAKIRGIQINTEYAEAFEVVRWIV